MRNKTKILKDIQAQIDNLVYVAIDADIDRDFPKEIKERIIGGYIKRIEELKEIKKKLEDLLI